MARYRHFIDTDVLTEARKRIHHIFDLFDTVVVMFSGGKDSLAVLHLTHEVMQERGITKPLDVVFRDEELIPMEVINFVNEYRQKDWINMVWYTVPLASAKFILGVCTSYLQWDNNREWMRPKPEWAVSLPPGDNRSFDQFTMDAFIAEQYRGKIAFLTGIRASESIMRFRASVNKLNENYINACSAKNVGLCKPIFDWSEDDVFKYFYDNGIKYCPIYDAEMWAGKQLRVATPLLAEGAKQMDALALQSPDFYQRLLEIFPDVAIQARYYRELDRAALQARWGQTYEGVRAWIEENLIEDEKQYRKAVDCFDRVMIRAGKDPDLYPPRYLLNTFMAGQYKREILPQVANRKKAS